MNKRAMMWLLALTLAFAPLTAAMAEVVSETLARSASSWDGSPYTLYPSGQPEITVLRMTIPPQTTLDWHTHPMPNAAYVMAGELTVEKQDGTKKRFTEGEVVVEVMNEIHRGFTGAQPVTLIVFYAGTPEMPLSEAVNQ